MHSLSPDDQLTAILNTTPSAGSLQCTPPPHSLPLEVRGSGTEESGGDRLTEVGSLTRGHAGCSTPVGYRGGVEWEANRKEGLLGMTGGDKDWNRRGEPVQWLQGSQLVSANMPRLFPAHSGPPGKTEGTLRQIEYQPSARCTFLSRYTLPSNLYVDTL